MKKKPIKIKFSLKLVNYLRLLQLSFFHPQTYALQIPKNPKFIYALGFFILNIVSTFVLKLFFQTIVLHKGSYFFFSISEAVVLIPFLILILFPITLILHLLIKLFGGKGNLGATFSALTFSSGPIIFSWVPLVSVIAFLLSIFLLANSLKSLHQISGLKATLILIIPLFLFSILSLVLGLASFLLLFIIGKSFV